MAKFDLKIRVEVVGATEAQNIGNLLQGAVNKVAYNDIVKLLEKVNQKPDIVKTALRFI